MDVGSIVTTAGVVVPVDKGKTEEEEAVAAMIVGGTAMDDSPTAMNGCAGGSDTGFPYDW